MNQLERMRERVEKTQHDLDTEREKEKRVKNDRERLAKNENADNYKLDYALCSYCGLDAPTLLKKHGNERLAYYLGSCGGCGSVVRREITLYDRYSDLSPRLRHERILHEDDLLTPNDPRFKTVYPDKWRELERQREERETRKV